MVKSKVIALAFSDLHLNMWAKFNEKNRRTLNGIEVLRFMSEEANKFSVPVLFCGDLLHKPESVDQDLLSIISDTNFGMNSKFLAISGNHDIKHTSIIGKKPVSWVSLCSDNVHLKCIDYESIKINPGYKVYGVPYVDHNIGLNDYLKKLKLDPDTKNILLLHTDYPGAKDTDDRTVDSVENLNINILNKFDLVLCGHIHKPQRLSKKVYMIGAPLQQRRTDKNCDMGYWEIYSDLSMKFIPLKNFPRFIDVATPEEIKDDGNYYTVLPQATRIEAVVKHKITKQLSKKSLAKHYMKAKGISDVNKENLLIDILKKSESQ